jgi:hypothetical protein
LRIVGRRAEALPHRGLAVAEPDAVEDAAPRVDEDGRRWIVSAVRDERSGDHPAATAATPAPTSVRTRTRTRVF